MIDESYPAAPVLELDDKPNIEAFKAELALADGTLIKLSKQSTDGKPLYIAARYSSNPLTPDVENDRQPHATLQALARKSTDLHSGVLLMDMYEGLKPETKRGKMKPIGHFDRSITGDFASGGGNWHREVKPVAQHEVDAEKKWNNYDALEVDEDYQGRGYGSMLVASSLEVLKRRGITTFFTGMLLGPGQSTWKRFGIRYKDFPPPQPGGSPQLLLERAVNHPHVNRTLSAFV